MILAGTVKLSAMSINNQCAVKSKSLLRRFEGYFQKRALGSLLVGELVLNLLGPKPRDGYLLSIDRTTWKAGKKTINILVVSVIFNSVGYPIYWHQLPRSTKQGNSRSEHRIAAFKAIFRFLNPNEICAILGDREFTGEHWQSWLDQRGISYVLRIKGNMLINGEMARNWFYNHMSSERVIVLGQKVYASRKQLNNGDSLLLISNGIKPKFMARLYKLRWGIEMLFSHTKKKGLNWEDTRIKDDKKLEALTGVIAVAFSISHLWGMRLEATNKIPIKNHGYKAISFFKRGFNEIQELLYNPPSEREKQFIRFLINLPKQKDFMGFCAKLKIIG